MHLVEPPCRPRYYLAVLPFGWYRVARSDVRLSMAYATCEGRNVEFVRRAAEIPDHALASGPIREITRAEALCVQAMCSHLVPKQFYLAALAMQIHAVEKVAPCYAEAGLPERTRMLEARLMRLRNRVTRIAAALHAPIHRVGLDRGPIPWSDETWQALCRIEHPASSCRHEHRP